MAARTFIWITQGGGAWNLAANWDDVTDGTNPSVIVPGPQDSVTVAGPAGNSVETLSGGGTVAAALFTGNSVLSGTYALGSLTVGQSNGSGMLELAAGALVASSFVTLTAGSLIANGRGTSLSVAGTAALGSATLGESANLEATGGGSIALLGLNLAAAAAALYVDGSSAIELGTLGTGATGALTIDPGFTLAGQGDANAYGEVVNNGTIAANASGGTLMLGTLTGAGLLTIGADATLALLGPAAAGETVDFTAAFGTLTLHAEFDAPAGTLTGFAAGDAIDIAGSAISSASFSQTSGSGGTLTLYYGTLVADRFLLAGNYANASFLTAGDGGTGTLITLASDQSNGGTPSPGTGTPDAYLWIAPGSGRWNAAANWEDSTRGQHPAAVAPGINDSDTVDVSQTSFTVIGGPANAAALLIEGELGLNGTYSFGTLAIGQSNGSVFTNGTLDFLAGTSIQTTNTSIAAGALSVAGSGSTLSASGTLSLGGGSAGVGLPVTALTVTAGGAVQADTVMIGGGSGDSIVTDPTGTVEIGTAGGARAGMVTVDQGATLTGYGSVNPLGAIRDNGLILATGGVLTLGAVTGSGVIKISNGVLQLDAVSNTNILFGANAGLAIAGEAELPTSGIFGLVPGDIIDVLGSPITGASFAERAAGNGGTLTLSYDGTIVGSLSLFGTFTQDQFLCVGDGGDGTDVELIANSTGGGGSGQTGTDPLSWIGAGGGNWSAAANWYDSATGTAATLPPGSQTPATITGPQGTNASSISGTGTCASLALSGNLVFSGSYLIGSLTLGSDPGTSTAVAGTVALTAGTGFSIASAFLADGLLSADGAGASLAVAGTLTLGDGPEAPELSIEGGAAASLGALVLGGGSLGVDAQSFLDIGTHGSAGAGTLAIDQGFAATGYGQLDPFGSIADAGTITALGGTLTVGAVSGGGRLSIGTESTLALAAGASTGIAFAGGGATLLLDAPALPASIIAGFSAGDAIVFAAMAPTAVTYTPGASGPGTLTLSANGGPVGTLLIAGNYAGDIFSLQPDGGGAALTVGAGGDTPPPGTPTPDNYVWTGADGVQWDNPGNWRDVTAGLDPAAVAPGQNDSISIAAGASLGITGPADAAALGFTGTLSLNGSYAIGTLSAGTAQQTGVLMLAAGDIVNAVDAAVLGGIAGQGGTLAAAGTLSLGAPGAAAGVVVADGATAISAETVWLAGPGSLLETDGSAAITVGVLASAQAGAVVVGADGQIGGNGAVNPSGDIIDDGMIAAAGGTLALGTVSGSGTLLIGPGATLEAAAAAESLTADFAGDGTLILGTAGAAPALADFGPSDTVILPVSGATAATYALEAPGSGVITVFGGTVTLATLIVEGNASDLVFSVAAVGGGGTALTATPANMAGSGGDTVSSPYPLTPGGNTLTNVSLLYFGEDDIPYAATALQLLDGGLTAYVYELVGTNIPGPSLYGPGYVPGINVEVVAAQPVENSQSNSYTLQPGYLALIALGSEQVDLTDASVGGALLVGTGNSNSEQPNVLTADKAGDTLIGATGSTTLFRANNPGSVYIQGGGNDTIVANGGNADANVTTAGGAHSRIFLGSSANYVLTEGADSVICAMGSNPSLDTVSVGSAAETGGPTVFGPLSGEVSVNGGTDYAWLIGNGGQLVMTGGAGNGNILFANTSNAVFDGGAGAAVVCGSETANDPILDVHGGSGALTVFGGDGDNFISGGAGPDTFVVGQGATTIAASTGDVAWLMDSAPVTVFGASGMQVYAGASSGNDIFITNGGSETMFGGAGSAEVYLNSGSGTLVPGSGHELIQFTNGLSSGSDEVVNFQAGLDVFALAGYGGALPALSYSHGNTTFTVPDGGPSVLVWGVHLTLNSFVSY